MHEKLGSASSSDMDGVSTEDDWVDARQIYHGTIADITFRPSRDNSPVTIKRDIPVLELLGRGPTSIMGQQPQQTIRWIHLPCNNMGWVEDLMAVLNNEQAERNAKTNEGRGSTSRLNGVLRDDVWRNVFHGRHSKAIHLRFLGPLATRYASVVTDDPDSDEATEKWQDANVLALFMPYLHWESYKSWKHRQIHIHRMKLARDNNRPCDCDFQGFYKANDEMKQKETTLLHQDLLADSPLHDRRTLDQSYFYNLSNVERKDEDQIVGLHEWNLEKSLNTDRKMMMVDQLWLWTIDSRTIITAFPEIYEHTDTETDISRTLFKNLPQAVQQGTVRSMNGLISHIIDNCTGLFHRSDITPETAFFEAFADEIGKVGTKVENMLAYFQEISSWIESQWTNDSITWIEMSRKLDNLFTIKQEIKLMAWIDKITSDLGKIDFLCAQQEDTLRDLIRCSRSSTSLTEICDTVVRYRASWAGMAVTAKSIREALLGLLDLKQRQASVSEARTIRGQIEISAKQGKSIMLLTVFTVLFLPISVMAAIFGMNAQEFVGPAGGKVSFGKISAITFPTTVTLMLLALAFAFTDESRNKVSAFLTAYRQKTAGERVPE